MIHVRMVSGGNNVANRVHQVVPMMNAIRLMVLVLLDARMDILGQTVLLLAQVVTVRACKQRVIVIHAWMVSGETVVTTPARSVVSMANV